MYSRKKVFCVLKRYPIRRLRQPRPRVVLAAAACLSPRAPRLQRTCGQEPCLHGPPYTRTGGVCCGGSQRSSLVTDVAHLPPGRRPAAPSRAPPLTTPLPLLSHATRLVGRFLSRFLRTSGRGHGGAASVRVRDGAAHVRQRDRAPVLGVARVRPGVAVDVARGDVARRELAKGGGKGDGFGEQDVVIVAVVAITFAAVVEHRLQSAGSGD